MLEKIRTWVRNEQYRPSPAGMLVNPFYIARRGLFLNMKAMASEVRGQILDIGCGSKPYRSLFPESEYVGLELDTPENRRDKKADVFYDGKSLPFPDGRFSIVLANQVLEHIPEPDPFLREIRRVLGPGGTLLITVPFLWDEHEKPLDFFRYTSFGIRVILQRSGFTIEKQAKSVQGILAVSQLLIGYVTRAMNTAHPAINLLTTAIFVSPLSVMAHLLALVLPGNSDLFLDSVVRARKSADGADPA